MKIFVKHALGCLILATSWVTAMEEERIDNHQLSTFSQYNYGHDFLGGGQYRFYYYLPQMERSEQRSESGEVEGHYAFVAPEGLEFFFKYRAGEEGFQVESDALPVAPEDTEDVKKAKEEFFDAYEKALELADCDEDGCSYEDSDESDESLEGEDSDESSEEDDDDDSDEDSEEEERREGHAQSSGFFSHSDSQATQAFFTPNFDNHAQGTISQFPYPYSKK